ncbi:MAG: hypothetical protein HW391_745, partial [Chloroflexi bacterium]|nr:hypothetical protein [Chloroflexota bacterium]
EYCQEELFPSGLESLAVPPETIMRVEVPGWQIVAWSGTCGHRDPANPTGGSFLISNSCSLGGSYPPDGQPPDGSPLPGPVVFLSRETGPVVRLYLTVARDGDTVSFSVYGSIPKS